MTHSESHNIPIRSNLEPGTVIRSTYTVLDFLGQGRFADTYRVRHRYMGIQAMKVLVDHMDEAERDACFTEAFVLSRLSAPGIVRVYDAGRLEDRFGGYPYITMEYIGGGTLQELLDEADAGLKLDAALAVGQQLADALACAHRLEPPLVHRDVKPANILLVSDRGASLQARLADFGLACHTDRFTRTVEAGGTLLYMAPESLRGFESTASDVFSLGLVLYELLTGTLPYPKHALAASPSPRAMRAALDTLHATEPDPPSYFDPTIPPDVDTVVLRCLTRPEPERLQTGSEVSTALGACRRALALDVFAQLDPQTRAELTGLFVEARTTRGFAHACGRLHEVASRHAEQERGLSPHLSWMERESDRLKEIVGTRRHEQR